MRRTFSLSLDARLSVAVISAVTLTFIAAANAAAAAILDADGMRVADDVVSFTLGHLHNLCNRHLPAPA